MHSRTGRLLKGIFASSHDPICLINLPRSPRDPHVPLGLLSLVSSLEKATLSAVILDLDLLHKKGRISLGGNFFESAVKEAGKAGKLFFGITADCANYPVAIELSRCLKDALPGIKVILGGPQATFLPVETLKVFHEIDCIVIGEGEVTLVELLNALKDGIELQKVRGIAYRDANEVVVTPPREYIRNLDAIPYPSFEMFPTKEYIKLSRERGIDPFLPIEAGRGCPKSCYFCATSRMWRGLNRMKSPARIFQEMVLCEKKFGIDAFELIHDNIAADGKFLKEFCHYIIERGSPFRWSCSASTDRLSRESIVLLKKAGCSNIFLGIESGSTRIQRIMGKRLDLRHADEVVKMCLDAGIDVVAAFILGFPEETLEDLDLTLRKALEYRELGAEIRLSKLSPLPGTPIYEEHIGQLIWDESPSTVSPFILECDKQRKLIQQYPVLFSSFYTLPNRNYVQLELSRATCFYDIVFSYYSQPLANILEANKRVGDGPVDILRFWERWRVERYPLSEITPDFVFYTFNEFLDAYSKDFYRRLGAALRFSPRDMPQSPGHRNFLPDKQPWKR